ncbi:unnamed protein product, partial [Symbiodinium sp. KB8]
LLLSIDMSRAFDKFPWLTLYTSLLVKIDDHECQVAGGQGLRNFLRSIESYRRVTGSLQPKNGDSNRPSNGSSEQAGLVELPSTIQGIACDVCGTYFPSYTNMMNHRRKKHRTAEPLPQQTTVNVYEHALDGMPQCRSLRVPQLIRSSASAVVTQTDAVASATSPTPVPTASQQPLSPARASPDDASLLLAEPVASGDGVTALDVPASAPAATFELLPDSLRSVRFFEEPDILQAASVGWEAVAQVPFAREKLLNHCPLCFMWHVAGNGNCKKHMNAKHKDHKAAVSRLRAECKAERTRFHGMLRGALSCLGLSSLCTFTSKAAMADLQEDSVTQQVGFFQHLLPSANPTLLSQMGVKGAEPLEGAPSKHRRLDKGGKGQGNGRQMRGQKRQGHQAPQHGLAPRGPQLDLRYILPLVLRMLLRQEDELQMIRLDKAFCLFVDPVQGDGCILKDLFKIAKVWKDKRDQDPPQVHAPLRMIMLEALLTEMKNRLKHLSENAEAQEMAIKNQWAVRQGVIIHPKREPILMRTVEERIEEALILCR